MIDKNALQGGLRPCSVFFRSMKWLLIMQNGMGEM